MRNSVWAHKGSKYFVETEYSYKWSEFNIEFLFLYRLLFVVNVRRQMRARHSTNAARLVNCRSTRDPMHTRFQTSSTPRPSPCGPSCAVTSARRALAPVTIVNYCTWSLVGAIYSKAPLRAGASDRVYPRVCACVRIVANDMLEERCP